MHAARYFQPGHKVIDNVIISCWLLRKAATFDLQQDKASPAVCCWAGPCRQRGAAAQRWQHVHRVPAGRGGGRRAVMGRAAALQRLHGPARGAEAARGSRRPAALMAGAQQGPRRDWLAEARCQRPLPPVAACACVQRHSEAGFQILCTCSLSQCPFGRLILDRRRPPLDLSRSLPHTRAISDDRRFSNPNVPVIPSVASCLLDYKEG